MHHECCLHLNLFRHGDAVTLFEKEAECGGHTLTDHSSPYPVDLGFQVCVEQLQFECEANIWRLFCPVFRH